MTNEDLILDCIYIDFSKVLDKISILLLLQKCEVYHLGAQMLNWIRDYLTGRMQQVNVGNFLSSTEMVSSGIPQGRPRVDPYIPQLNKSGGPDGTYLYILHEYCIVLCQPLSPLAVQVIIKSF